MGQDVVHALDTPEVPYFVNDIGLDGLYSVTIAGAAPLAAGTVLGKVTATGKYVAYSNAAVDGSQTAVGILYHRVEPSAGNDVLGSMQVEGHVRRGSLTGLDAAAEAELAPKFHFVD